MKNKRAKEYNKELEAQRAGSKPAWRDYRACGSDGSSASGNQPALAPIARADAWKDSPRIAIQDAVA